MKINIFTKTTISITCLLVTGMMLNAQKSPWTVVSEMGRGINMGNTLEAPSEGAWAKAAQEYFFDDYKNAGFSTVRIPVKWDSKTSKSSPFTIDPNYMNRVEQVVDWALNRNFYVILNTHHESWIKENYNDPVQRARFDSIWSQISLRFKDKSEKLLFEIINEPINMTGGQVDDLNKRVIPLIRKSNPTRIIIYCGNDYSGLSNLRNAAVPNDNYLIGYFHSYDPWSFAGEAKGLWTETDKPAIVRMFSDAASWAVSKNIPVIISEFGAVRTCDYNSRMRHYAAYTEEALRNNIAFQVWDDEGDFGIYNRTARTFNEIVDILTKAYPNGPTALKATIASGEVTLEWTNRTTAHDSVFIEKRVQGGKFLKIASLPSGASSFKESGLTAGSECFYRVIAHFNNSTDWYSYPFRVYFTPTERSRYGTQAITIPGTIEAENYDIGGELLTYHDIETANRGNAYRLNEGVDIETRPADNGFHVGYVAAGEWIEYTVNVQNSGQYQIATQVASMNGGGVFNIQFGNAKTLNITAPITNSWQTTQEVKSFINLTAGEQIMRVNIVSEPGFNLDKFIFTAAQTNGIADNDRPMDLAIFPNPFNDQITIKSQDLKKATANIYNTTGTLMASFDLIEPDQKLDLSFVTSGLYIVELKEGQTSKYKTIVKL